MRRFTAIALAMLLLFSVIPPVQAEEAIPIYTIVDLLAISRDPSGSYVLMEDLDMTGVIWEGLDFRGSFNGNGHAILNLTVTQLGKETATSYDGNLKAYDTYFAGFFNTLIDAQVTDLTLYNVQALIDTDVPCFLGGLTGFSENSTITGCTVTGTLELRAFDRIFGVGGIVGYGSGTVESCTADVTLICTDTDPNTLDEQFLGGIFSTGFVDVLHCTVHIDGYCSEYGYVHNGGITGMYMQQPLGAGRMGQFIGNYVEGKITFFECNANRRAYCAPFAGEVLADWYYFSDDNRENFIRDERTDYTTELRPEMCGDPSYDTVVTDPGCDTYGYTQHTCRSCSYTYRDSYTLFSHSLTQWMPVEAPTTESEGLSKAACDLCGKEFFRTEPMLEPPPTEATVPVTVAPETQPMETESTVPQSQPVPQPEPDEGIPVLVWILSGVGVVLIILLILLLRPRKQQKGGKFLKT